MALTAWLVVPAALVASPAFAANGTWTGSAGATWDTSATNWANLSGTPWDVTNGGTNAAIFNSANFSSTVSGSVWLNAITLNETGTVSGGTITFAGSTPTITATSGKIATISVTLAGATALTKSGSGTLVLSGSNSYSGGTTLSSGTLLLGNASALGSGGLTPSTNTTLGASTPLTGANKVTNALTIGLSTVTIGGTNALELGGVVTAGSGGNTSLQFNNTGTTTLSGALWISSTSINRSLNLSGTADVVISGSIGFSTVVSGSGNLNYTGSGVLTLSGTNTYGGTTIVYGGGVLSSPNFTAALQNSSAVRIGTQNGAATLRYTGTGEAFNKLIYSGGSSSETAGTTTTIEQAGTGLLQFTNAASVSVQTGSSVINSTLVLQGSTSGTGELAGTVNTSTNLASTLNVTKRGSGTWILSSTASTYNGRLTIEQGTLQSSVINNASSNGPLGNSSLSVLMGGSNGTAGTFAYGGSSSATSTKPFTLVTGGTGGFNVVTATTTLTLSGAIDGAGALLKVGAGTLALSGSNTYAGTTFINQGGLVISSTASLPGYDTAGRFSVASGASLAVGNGVDDSAVAAILGTSNLAAGASFGFDTSAGDRTYGSGIASGIGLVKRGANTLTLSASNGFTGTTTLYGGTLALGDANALAGGGNVTFFGGALRYTASNTTDYTARIAGSGAAVAIDTNNQNITFTGGIDATNVGGFTKLGAGTLTLSGSSNYTGTTTLAGGVLALNNPNAIAAAGNVAFTGGTLQYSAVNTIDIASRIASSTSAITIDTNGQSATWAGSIASTNTGGLVKTGAGTLTLSGSNAFSGTITVLGGTLGLNAANAVPTAATSIVLDGGVLVRSSTTVTSLTKPFSIGAGGGEIRVTAGQWTVSGAVTGGAGTGSLVLNGISGDLVFGSESSTYTGGTRIPAGSGVAAQADAAFGSGTISFEGGSIRTTSGAPRVFANPVVFAGNTEFTTVYQNLTFNGSATILGSTRTITVSSTNALAIYNGSIGDGGNALGFTKAGVGTLILGGSNTYSGATTLSAGTIQLRNPAALQNSTLSLSGAGGVVFDSAVSGNAFTLGGLAASSTSATLALQNSAATAIALTVGGNNASTTYAGSLTGGGSLEKVGAGSLVLSGSNTFAGTTTVTGGTLALGGANALAGGGNITFSGGGLRYTASNQTDLSARIVSSGSAVRIDTNGQSVTWTSSLDSSNVGGLTKLGSGTLTLSAANALTGPVTVGGGVLAIGNAGALPSSGNVTFTSGTLQYSSSYSADLSSRIVGSSAAIAIDTNGQSRTWASGLDSTNVGGLTKSGNGTLTLSASNAYSGATTVSGGALLVNHAAALGSGTSVSVSANGASLTIGNGITAGAGKTVAVNSNGSGVANSDGGLNVLAGTGTWAGDVLITTAIGRLGYNTGNLVVTGSVGGSSITVSGYGGDTNTNIAGYAVTLAGPTGYSGATNILRGWLRIGADNALPAGTTLDVFTVANNASAAQAATFDLNGFNQTVASLTSSGNNGKTGYANGYVTNTGGAVKTLTVNQATTGTYGGLITGNLAFTKTGAGDLTLMPIFVTGVGNAFVSGTNTFTGDTRVDGGTLTLSTATGNTSLALAGSTFDSDGVGALSFGTMTAATFGSLKGSGNLSLQNGSSQAVALTVGANNGSNTFSGGLSGAGSLIKAGVGTLTLSGSSTYAGLTTVSSGSLVVDGSLSSAVALAGSTSLSGRGSVGAISGAGLVGPGNSPGILMATSVDPSGGLSFAFEFSQANPDYTNAAASGNDVLSISGLSPFASSLTSSNVVSIYLTPAAVELGTLTGGFFTSSIQSDFLSSISSATYQYFVQDAGGSFSYNGLSYKSLAQYDPSKSGATLSTVAANGGQVMQLVVVPEPAGLALAGIGAALAGWRLACRRRRSA